MEEKQVLLESENIVSFDKLFIGTGALPNLLFRSPFCLSVRDKASVIDLGKRVSTSTHVVIVGNGAIAMEMVEALRGTPIDITWVVKDSYVGNTFFDQVHLHFSIKIFENRRRSDCHEYAIPHQMQIIFSGKYYHMMMLRIRQMISKCLLMKMN